MDTFKKTPFLIFILLLIFLSSVFFLLYREIYLNNEKAGLSMTELENEINRRDNIKLLNNSIQSIKQDKALLETHFGKTSDIVPFLDTVEGLGPKAGVQVETTSVDILADGGGLLVKLNTSGNFKNIYKFLTLLENSPYELEVSGMDMQKETNSITMEEPGWQAMLGIKLLSFVQ
ncbi:MAG TPA: hypothetical protein VGO63_03140 [Candidatus Paceibacterota bacterium]|jgi:hypothetical protein|nr:hypothetical protein [Candidatus Paceibacterota bacterium]